jgi:hypothetical protein
MCDESDYSASSCRLYRDYSNEDYSKLKIYKVCSSVYDKCYIGMCCNDLEDELKWIKDQYVYWCYGGGYVKKELYELICMGGDVSIENIRSVCCENKDECVIYLNEVLKLYIDSNECVNKKLWTTKNDKLNEYESSELKKNREKKELCFVYEDMDVKIFSDNYDKINYSYGKIYKIISSNSELCYIGSTTQSLYERFENHKGGYNNYVNSKKNYVSSYDIIGCGGELEIVLLEKYSCKNKAELLAREGKYISEYGSKCVNMIVNSGKRGKEYLKKKCDEEVRKDISDYKNSKLFRLKSVKSGRYYIGVTVINLDEMLKLCMDEYEKFKYGKLKSRKDFYNIMDDGEVCIELIENYECGSLKVLKERQKEILEGVKDDINCINKIYKIKLL